MTNRSDGSEYEAARRELLEAKASGHQVEYEKLRRAFAKNYPYSAYALADEVAVVKEFMRL